MKALSPADRCRSFDILDILSPPLRSVVSNDGLARATQIMGLLRPSASQIGDAHLARNGTRSRSSRLPSTGSGRQTGNSALLTNLKNAYFAPAADSAMVSLAKRSDARRTFCLDMTMPLQSSANGHLQRLSMNEQLSRLNCRDFVTATAAPVVVAPGAPPRCAWRTPQVQCAATSRFLTVSATGSAM